MEKHKFFIPNTTMLVFRENPQKKGFYDLQPNHNGFNKFKYFHLQYPKTDRLKRTGAKYVIDSWLNREKILHTSLLPLNQKSFYMGDFTEIIEGVNKRSLFVLWYRPDNLTIYIYWFNHFDKKSLKMRLNFCNEYINRLIKKGASNTP